MRKTIYLFIALLGIVGMTGCGSSEESGPNLQQQIAGEWHLSSWSSETPADYDVYLSLDAQGTFEIYQRMEKVYYQKFTGSFLVKSGTLSGTYSDKTPLGSEYEVSLDTTGNQLTLVSTSAEEVSVYTRATIPSDVKSGAKATAASRAEDRRPL